MSKAEKIKDKLNNYFRTRNMGEDIFNYFSEKTPYITIEPYLADKYLNEVEKCTGSIMDTIMLLDFYIMEIIRAKFPELKGSEVMIWHDCRDYDVEFPQTTKHSMILKYEHMKKNKSYFVTI